MKYDIVYKGMEPDAKKAKALQDIKDYLDNTYEETVEKMMAAQPADDPPSFRAFTFSCEMFLGIEGYPVKVWYEHLFKVEAKKD